VITVLFPQVQISRLEPSKHEKETLEKLSDSTTELKPRRKRKRVGGPNPLSVMKSKKRKDGIQKATGDTKVPIYKILERLPFSLNNSRPRNKL